MNRGAFMPEFFPDAYLPRGAMVAEVIVENSQIRTFVLSFTDPEYNRNFSYRPGQFLMVSLPHCGEAPISFSSSPARPGSFQLSVRRAGKLTAAMHALRPGDRIGLRGPYGRPFPMERLAGQDLLFVAGGIGLAPLRSVVATCLAEREKYGRITVLYGSRAPSDIAFRADLEEWQHRGECDCRLTVDAAGEGDGWEGPVGVVTRLLEQVDMAPERSTALVCGPPLMIRAVLGALSMRGFADERILTTMERHMKCGIGICRHCHMDAKLVCVDGPVFSLAELRGLAGMEFV
jgi:NAD(P)H-flavin reductase